MSSNDLVDARASLSWLAPCNEDSKDPDTLQNLAVCSLHLGKPVTRFINQLKTLTPKPSAIEQLESLEAAFDSANSAYVAA